MFQVNRYSAMNKHSLCLPKTLLMGHCYIHIKLESGIRWVVYIPHFMHWCLYVHRDGCPDDRYNWLFMCSPRSWHLSLLVPAWRRHAPPTKPSVVVCSLRKQDPGFACRVRYFDSSTHIYVLPIALINLEIRCETWCICSRHTENIFRNVKKF